MSTPIGATQPGARHHRARLNGTELHYVALGDDGPPILLVHGFPETWWAFHKLMPLLAARHRVVAVDLRGFGDSSVAAEADDSRAVAEDLRRLVAHLAVGPVHLVGQDIAGAAVVRLAVTAPGDVASVTAIEMGLPGFGLERLADVTRGGAWHIGALAAPGIADLLFAGRERALLRDALFRPMIADPAAVSDATIDEFARGYARPGGWRGAAALYRSMLREGADLRALVADKPIAAPVLAIGAGGGAFTATTMAQVAVGPIRSVQLDGVGHYVALEAPGALAETLRAFIADVTAG